MKNYDYTLLIIIFSAVIIGIILLGIFAKILKNKKRKHTPKNLLRQTKVEIKNKKIDVVKITFVTNSTQTIEPLISEKFVVIDLPSLQKSHFEFCGWYTDKICLNPYVNNGVNDNLTLYAKWRLNINK